jgi:tRNA G26 N,N-dimethylase Trm1
MGSYSIEEITLDAETGRKTGRRKMGDQYPGKDDAKMTEDDGEEEEKGDGKTKIREKYQLAQVRVPHRCTVCEGALVLGGPIWNREIHDVEFVKRLLESVR